MGSGFAFASAATGDAGVGDGVDLHHHHVVERGYQLVDLSQGRAASEVQVVITVLVPDDVLVTIRSTISGLVRAGTSPRVIAIRSWSPTLMGRWYMSRWSVPAQDRPQVVADDDLVEQFALCDDADDRDEGRRGDQGVVTEFTRFRLVQWTGWAS